MENDLTLKNSSSSILAQPNQPSPFSFSFSRAGLLRRPVPTACPQLHRAAHSAACSLGPAAPFPHRPATARGPAQHLAHSAFTTPMPAAALSLPFTAHCPHLSAPFFFFPFFFLSFPFFTAGAFLFSGHHRWQAIRAVARLWKAANPPPPFPISPTGWPT